MDEAGTGRGMVSAPAVSGKRVGGKQYQRLRAIFRAECVEEDRACWICDQPIAYDEEDGKLDDSFELDHYYPIKTHPQFEMDPANFQASHRSCNRSRGSGAPTPPVNNTSRDWNRKGRS